LAGRTAWYGTGDLPPETTHFVGRRREVARVRRMLQRSRLVTVTGVGGVGKTRVALRAAATVRRAFPDGVWLVELSGLTDPGQVEHAVAHALELTGRSAGPAAALVAHVADRRLLLILDTCEHLVEAAARLVQTLLAAAPGLRVLVTSRERLGIPGEYIVPIPPMATPDPPGGAADLARCDSVALFLDRAAAVDPAFGLTELNARAVAELCVRLEGIPLAIELAAVRARAVPLEVIAGPVPARHRAVSATIEWSHELCTWEERLAWARLSVFAGPFRLAAAEAVCADRSLPADRVFPAVAGLVDKSIVLAVKHDDGTSYRLLDSIREFGLARLDASGERRRMLLRHRDHYLALAGGAGPPGAPAGQALLWRGVRRDWSNIRAALDLCVAEAAEAETGLRIVTRLWFLWNACGMAREGRHYLERLLALVPGPSRMRSWGLLVLAYVAAAQGDAAAAKRALDLVGHEMGLAADRTLWACLTKMRGTLAYCEGRFADAERRLEVVVGPMRRDLPPAALTAALAELGLSRAWRGDADGAEAALTECLGLCARHGDTWVRSYADYGLGMVKRERGDLASAASRIRDALRAMRALPDVLGMLQCLEVLAWLAADQGDLPRAARLLHSVRSQWRRFGLALLGSPLFLAEHARCEAAVGRWLTTRERELAVRQGQAMDLDETIAYALGEDGARPAGGGADRAAPLTPREWEVAELLAEGLTNREIADRLVVVPRTVDTHVGHILAKLGFSARTQVAAWVTRRAG
jgi:predicted ATPase/DNA-binding CsgD family transcriptional regulator